MPDRFRRREKIAVPVVDRACETPGSTRLANANGPLCVATVGVTLSAVDARAFTGTPMFRTTGAGEPAPFPRRERLRRHSEQRPS